MTRIYLEKEGNVLVNRVAGPVITHRGAMINILTLAAKSEPTDEPGFPLEATIIVFSAV